MSTQIDNEKAANVIKELYDIDGKAIALPGELDPNFNIKTDSLSLSLFKTSSVHELAKFLDGVSNIFFFRD